MSSTSSAATTWPPSSKSSSASSGTNSKPGPWTPSSTSPAGAFSRAPDSAPTAPAATTAAPALPRPAHVPLIARQLANPMTSAEAQSALAAYGPGIEDLIGPILRASDEPLEVRRAIPEVLARGGTQPAADILREELVRRRDG